MSPPMLALNSFSKSMTHEEYVARLALELLSRHDVTAPVEIAIRPGPLHVWTPDEMRSNGQGEPLVLPAVRSGELAEGKAPSHSG